MSSLEAEEGDTFELISRRVYGTESEAERIRQANPGLTENLLSGTQVKISPSPSSPQNTPHNTSSKDDTEVSILIEGKRFRHWTSVTINQSLDSLSKVSFSAPMESSNKAFRETFKPFSFKPVNVHVGGDLLFSGVMVLPYPRVTNTGKSVAVNCYALPGVLNDCTAPVSLFPLEFEQEGLKAIAEKLSSPFGIAAKFTEGEGAPFENVTCDFDKKILSFLAELAKQRNLVISNTKEGALLFQKAVSAGVSVDSLKQGQSPLVEVSASFNAQQYYSDISGIDPVMVGVESSAVTKTNPFLSDALRPFTFSVNDSSGEDVVKSVDAKMGLMFGNMVTYTAVVATWNDANGNLWKPNTLIDVEAPDAMIYKKFQFLIRNVVFSRSKESVSAVLTLVIPGSFSGKIPESLPWE